MMVGARGESPTGRRRLRRRLHSTTMGERASYTLFKGVSEAAFHGALSKVAEKHAGHFELEPTKDWDSSCSIASWGGVHGLIVSHRCPPMVLSHIAGALGQRAWLQVRIQEGSLWDMTLYNGSMYIDNFSTLPEYWGDDDPLTVEWKKGRPALLALAWDVPIERIERYYRQWGMRIVDDDTFETILRGKAYETDQSEYGSIWQAHDFMRALGADPEGPWTRATFAISDRKQ